MIKNVVFDLSEVLLPGLIGVEDKLQLRTGKPGNLIAQALGSYPYYQDNNNLDKLLKSEMSYPEYRTAFLLANLMGACLMTNVCRCLSNRIGIRMNY